MSTHARRRSTLIASALASALALALALAAAAPPAALAQGAGEAPDKSRNLEKMGEDILFTVEYGGKEITVEEVLRDWSEKFKFVMAFDEALRGKKIRFYTSGPISFNVLREVLAMYGVEIVFHDVDGRQIMKVALQRNIPQLVGSVPSPFFQEGEKLPATDQVVTAVYQVKYADANAAQQAIRALMTRDPKRIGNIFPSRESLIITDLKSNVEFYLKIMQAIDVQLPGFDYDIVQVQYAAADELANMVNTLYRTIEASGGTGAPGAPPQPGQPPRPAGPGGPVQAQVVADARTNKVVILALPVEIPKIREMIAKIDVRVDPPPRHFHVYKCVNAYADDLANALNSLFGGATTQTFGQRPRQTPRRTTPTGTSGRTGGLFGRQPVGAQPQPAPAPAMPAAGRAPGLPGGQLNPGEGTIETRFVPDPQTNSILIQAAPDDYREILAVLKELDKKRSRVAIEAEVYEISVSDDLLFALEGAMAEDARTTPDHPAGDSGQPLRGHGIGSFGLLAPDANALAADPSKLGLLPNLGQGAALGIPATLPQGGLIFLLTKGGFDKVPLIVQALAAESNANLLTKPMAVTNDNEGSRFEISESRPFAITSSNAVSNFQGFDRAEATSYLDITPRISSANNLTLTIDLQIESFGAQPNPNAPPNAQRRTYQGTVTVPNRQYVVFGGLEQEARRESRSKIPILGDIPILGYLFGRTSFGTSRTRIYIFIRPVILTDDDFAGERKVSTFLRDDIRAQSLIPIEKTRPILPDEVLDAETANIRSAIYGVFGDGMSTAFPEHEKTRAARQQATQGR